MLTHLLPMLQESASGVNFEYSSQGSLGPVGTIVLLAVIVFMIAVGWKIFTKAGEPGWASIVPIYNIIVWLKIAGKPWWWLFLCLIPFVNFIIGILWCLGLAKNFGKGGGFAVGILFLGIIFLPILAFGDAKFVGQKG
jgi:hypothetical protein